MKIFSIRNIANNLIKHTKIIAAYDRRSWTLAMAVEIKYIKSDWEALNFAIGCFATMFMENLKMKKFEPLVRWILASCALAWATAKIYLLAALFENSGDVTDNVVPLWLYVILIAAAFSYAGLAFSLFKKKHLLVGVFFVAALATNSVLFALTQVQFLLLNFQPTEKLTWFFAIISEEYFMWTAILFGAAIMLVLKNLDRAKSVLWPA